MQNHSRGAEQKEARHCGFYWPWTDKIPYFHFQYCRGYLLPFSKNLSPPTSPNKTRYTGLTPRRSIQTLKPRAALRAAGPGAGPLADCKAVPGGQAPLKQETPQCRLLTKAGRGAWVSRMTREGGKEPGKLGGLGTVWKLNKNLSAEGWPCFHRSGLGLWWMTGTERCREQIC